jgi:hypothetical protein
MRKMLAIKQKKDTLKLISDSDRPKGKKKRPMEKPLWWWNFKVGRFSPQTMNFSKKKENEMKLNLENLIKKFLSEKK